MPPRTSPCEHLLLLDPNPVRITCNCHYLHTLEYCQHCGCCGYCFGGWTFSCCCCATPVFSMNSQIICLLACLSLHFTAGVDQWEVINDVKPYDDSGTQDQILSEEELIPFRPSKPKSRPAPTRREHVDTVSSKKTAPVRPVQKSIDVGEEELLPLGVQKHANNRHLLQVVTMQGPNLPIDMELKRQRLTSDAVNLSTACKESGDKDCLTNVDDYLAKQITNGLLQKAEDDLLQSRSVSTKDSEEDHDMLQVPNSRHKRQVDTTIETSGDDELYTNTSSHGPNEGVYRIPSQMQLMYPFPSFTDAQRAKYKAEFENSLTDIYNGTMPGFSKVEVGEPYIEDGKLKVNYTVVIDGSNFSPNEVSMNNLEEFLTGQLNSAVLPLLQNFSLGNFTIPPGFNISNILVDDLRTILGGYCQSENPCANDGPEYNISACANVGFMAGFCPHKCSGFPCLNKAECELDAYYNPQCNCGSRYEGTFCEREKTTEKGLTTGEEVGVGVASAAAILALVSCFIFALLYRRKKDVAWSYYEDEGNMENNSDPTIANYYIDRPIISEEPIAVFNPNEGFDA